uniref:Uncharacterized protein n=1 Tax=Anguilla anguilla TaxID=7936 RepID=A0A0E9RHL2_ANGAN
MKMIYFTPGYIFESAFSEGFSSIVFNSV